MLRTGPPEALALQFLQQINHLVELTDPVQKPTAPCQQPEPVLSLLLRIAATSHRPVTHQAERCLQLVFEAADLSDQIEVVVEDPAQLVGLVAQVDDRLDVAAVHQLGKVDCAGAVIVELLHGDPAVPPRVADHQLLHVRLQHRLDPLCRGHSSTTSRSGPTRELTCLIRFSSEVGIRRLSTSFPFWFSTAMVNVALCASRPI